MGANEIAVLRDVLVVVAAAALVVASVFGLLVSWRVWSLLRATRHDAGPLLAALTDTVHTVRDTLRYVADKVAVPAADGLAAAGATRAAATGSLGARLRRFNAALRGAAPAPAAPAADPRDARP